MARHHARRPSRAETGNRCPSIRAPDARTGLEQLRARGLALHRLRARCATAALCRRHETIHSRDQHRLREIDRGEFRRRDGDRPRRKAKSRRCPGRRARCRTGFRPLAARARRRAGASPLPRASSTSLGDAALARRRGENEIQIGERLAQTVANSRASSTTFAGARRHRSRLCIRPAGAGRDQTQIGEAEIRHRPRRRADILAELRMRKDDGGRRELRCRHCFDAVLHPRYTARRSFRRGHSWTRSRLPIPSSSSMATR